MARKESIALACRNNGFSRAQKDTLGKAIHMYFQQGHHDLRFLHDDAFPVHASSFLVSELGSSFLTSLQHPRDPPHQESLRELVSIVMKIKQSYVLEYLHKKHKPCPGCILHPRNGEEPRRMISSCGLSAVETVANLS